MGFTDGKPFTVTENDIHRPWSGGANGKYFRCGLCGYKFKAGDIARWVFTNSIKGAAGGNPFTCQKCDGSDVIDRWTELNEEWKREKNGRFWMFTRQGGK